MIVPPIGALGERVTDTGAGWVLTDAEWNDESRMLDRVQDLVGAGERARARAGGERARELASPRPRRWPRPHARALLPAMADRRGT